MSDADVIKIEPYKHLTASRPYMSKSLRIGIDPYDINNIISMRGAVITYGSNSFIIECSAGSNSVYEIQFCEQLLVLLTSTEIVFVDCIAQKILHIKAKDNGWDYVKTVLTNKQLICASFNYSIDDGNLRIDIDIFDIKTYSNIASIKNIDLKHPLFFYSFNLDSHDENLVKVIGAEKVGRTKYKCLIINLMDKSVIEYPASCVVDIAGIFQVHNISFCNQKLSLLATIDNNFITVIEYDVDGVVIEHKNCELNIAKTRKNYSYDLDDASCVYSPRFNCLVNMCQLDSCSNIYYTDVMPYFDIRDKTSGLHTKLAIKPTN